MTETLRLARSPRSSGYSANGTVCGSQWISVLTVSRSHSTPRTIFGSQWIPTLNTGGTTQRDPQPRNLIKTAPLDATLSSAVRRVAHLFVEHICNGIGQLLFSPKPSLAATPTQGLCLLRQQPASLKVRVAFAFRAFRTCQARQFADCEM
jgi:hypothetical protein